MSKSLGKSEGNLIEATATTQAYQRCVETAANQLRERLKPRPEFGLILGTGLGAFTHHLARSFQIPYRDIPGMPESTAPGHSGTLHYGHIGDRAVLVFEGRFHFYEGYSLREVTMPVRLLSRLGVKNLILTNACGGMNPALRKGDLLLIDDHINLIGANPLIGRNIDEWGPRFPDMARPYDAKFLQRLRAIAADEGIRAPTGVYVAVAGPNLETRAEYRMLRQMGADVVGMSTVPEAVVAVHEGLRVAAISVVTDTCDPDHLEPVSVAEILQVAADAEPKLTKLILRLIQSAD
ncbi:MAG: purine-nucleoside phosphorylase [Planctomycetota bacterium]